jgi:hypothetical protein
MTLLKEKLEAAIAEWEEPEGKQLFRVTNNVTRATFDMVRDNPGIARKEAVEKLRPMGYKPSSTATLISQMIRQRLIRIEGNALYANFSEYTPLKTGLRSQPKAAKKAKKATVKVETPAPRSAIITTNYDVHNVIKNLTIYQAKELRDTLNNLFK